MPLQPARSQNQNPKAPASSQQPRANVRRVDRVRVFVRFRRKSSEEGSQKNVLRRGCSEEGRVGGRECEQLGVGGGESGDEGGQHAAHTLVEVHIPANVKCIAHAHAHTHTHTGSKRTGSKCTAEVPQGAVNRNSQGACLP